MRPLPEIIQRIYTAIPLVGIACLATFYFNFAGFLLLDTLLILLIGWEWAKMIGYAHRRDQLLYLFVLLVGCLGMCYVPVKWLAQLSLLMGALLVSNIIVALFYGRQGRCPREVLAILGGVYLSLAWYMLCFLKGAPVCLGIGLLIVVLTDTLAYIVGKHWGNFRLAPGISPHKTWEGCLAGLLGPLFVVLMIDRLSGYPFYVSQPMAGIILLTTLTTIAGDLFESAIKRQHGLKDSGNGLPGHGGWLDRFDGLICAIPVFSASLIYLTTF